MGGVHSGRKTARSPLNTRTVRSSQDILYDGG